MNNVTTRLTPVKSLTGEFLMVAAGTSADKALERADHALASALAVVELIPHQDGIDAEALAYAAAELLYTAQAMLTALRDGMEVQA